ncbi:hypothetical protein CDAR_207231 [Caerostris darwini]|uniref:Uncharacterized protein n=1 Tax=Caerostris darwini TaxID=1538125 RepID=A0AAV4SRS3_9ARAC|nr:hypothetical protein CDAR_207231 [Caerostris darwini]
MQSLSIHCTPCDWHIKVLDGINSFPPVKWYGNIKHLVVEFNFNFLLPSAVNESRLEKQANHICGDTIYRSNVSTELNRASLITPVTLNSNDKDWQS